MLNHVKFKDELLELLLRRGGLAVVNGKPDRCHMLLCSICEFRKGDKTCDETCKEKRLNWLYSQHIEKPKLTQREWHLCKALKTRYLARGENGALYLYGKKPHKSGGMWFSPGVIVSVENIMPDSFSFIKWQDAEPWSVEDLLKLEVEK